MPNQRFFLVIFVTCPTTCVSTGGYAITYGMIKDEDKAVITAVGKEFRVLRQQAGLSLRALAAKAGMSHVTVTEIENGQEAGYTKFFKLATALGKTPDYFYQVAMGNGTTPDGQHAQADAPAPRHG